MNTEKEERARDTAQIMAPKPFEPVPTERSETEQDLIAVAYATWKRDHPGGGDYEKYVKDCHAVFNADYNAYIKSQTAKNLKEGKRKEAIEAAHGKTVGEIFEATFLPTVNQIDRETWNKVKVPTSEGEIDFDPRAEIIDRAGEWSGDNEKTRKALVKKYLGFTYERRLLKGGVVIGRVMIGYHLR